jgi:ferrochelatase
MATKAVVLSCHGSVERLEDIPAFLRNIRRGKPAPQDVVDEVTRRYRHIGGSPFMRITREQAAALEERLHVPVRAAGRLWHPYPSEVLAELAETGIGLVVSLPVAPQSVHIYHPSVAKAAAERGLEVLPAPSYGLQPELVFAFVEAIEEARARLPTVPALVLTAHSLPQHVIDAGDPYERDFRAMADAVLARLRERGTTFAHEGIAFQSQGMGGGAWIGPSLEGALDELSGAGVESLLVAPIGFVADHVETLYDIDVEIAARARGSGFRAFERMAAMNTRPGFLAALEAVARPLLDRA